MASAYLTTMAAADDARLEELKAAHPEGVPLLLHACCGPCSLEPVHEFIKEGFKPTICWTNPNIQPVQEHNLRLETIQSWAKDVAHLDVIVAGDDRAKWEQTVSRHGFDREMRCRACYAIRLEEACKCAVEKGFTCISTTLAVSPYQLFDTCSDVLIKLAHAHGLIPVVRDYRPLYDAAKEESRELGMYRQNYCGCRYSAAEATLERQAARDARKAQKRAHIE